MMGTNYSEASYYHGAHFQHIAEWADQQRRKMGRKISAAAHDRRRNGRARR